MAQWKPNRLLLFIHLTVFSDATSAYYCEFHLCEVDEYCCGDNQCCSNVYSLWYFWAGIIFLIILLSSCGGLCRYYRPQIIVHQITNFVPVPAERPCLEEQQGLIAYEDVEAAHPESPPPPYSVCSKSSKELK